MTISIICLVFLDWYRIKTIFIASDRFANNIICVNVKEVLALNS